MRVSSAHAQRTPTVARPSFALPPTIVFMRATPVLNPLDCRLRAAECEKMAEGAPNPRVQAILTDMARTWTRLAVEAEQALKKSRPPLQLVGILNSEDSASSILRGRSDKDAEIVGGEDS